MEHTWPLAGQSRLGFFGMEHTWPLGAGIPEPALDGRGGEVGAVHGVLLVPSLLRLAVLHVVRQVLLPLH